MKFWSDYNSTMPTYGFICAQVSAIPQRLNLLSVVDLSLITDPDDADTALVGTAHLMLYADGYVGFGPKPAEDAKQKKKARGRQGIKLRQPLFPFKLIRYISQKNIVWFQTAFSEMRSYFHALE